MRKIVVFGHSHLGALTAAYASADVRATLDFELFPFQFLRSDRPQFVNPDNAGWRYHPDIERELVELIKTVEPDAAVVMMHGEQAISAGLIAPAKPYDFFFPGETGYTPYPASEIIPFELMLKLTVAKYHTIADFLDFMRERLPPLAFGLCPPPPVGDRQFILNSGTQHEDISNQIKKYGLPSMAWRNRIWKINALAMREVYGARGIGFVDPPNAAFDDNGLRPEYRADVFHANAAYGELLLKQIDRLLASQAAVQRG